MKVFWLVNPLTLFLNFDESYFSNLKFSISLSLSSVTWRENLIEKNNWNFQAFPYVAKCVIKVFGCMPVWI